MGLTVNRQMAKKLTVNRQKRNIFTVNRQMNEPKLAVKFLSSLVPRAFSLNLARSPTAKPGKRSSRAFSLAWGWGPRAGNEVDFSDILKRSRPSSYAVNK